jgi:spore coat polysaccharide biosynthesis protein SpsF
LPADRPQVVDRVIEELQTRGLDFAANRLPPPFKRTFPIGLDVEVVRMPALAEAWENAKEQHEREHVMPYFYAGPRKFAISVLDAQEDQGSQRWTVDTPEDLEFIRKIAALLDRRMDFTWLEVLDLVQTHPDLTKINAGIHHKFMKEVDERANKK